MRKTILIPLVLLAAPLLRAQDASEHLVSADSARAMIKAWQTQNVALVALNQPQAFAFNAAALKALMNQSGAAGIRFYYALNAGRPTLVAFAYDSNGKELSLALENAIPCPPFCN